MNYGRSTLRGIPSSIKRSSTWPERTTKLYRLLVNKHYIFQLQFIFFITAIMVAGGCMCGNVRYEAGGESAASVRMCLGVKTPVTDRDVDSLPLHRLS